MNKVLIFAGGVGQRMHSVSLPKQFLKVHDKPIIVHTIEKFQNCNAIDSIVVVCVCEYIDYMYELVKRYRLFKVQSIVPGGSCGQDSIFNGLKEMIKSSSEKDIVLIHDGVRPIIDEKTILENIECVKKYGNAITTAKSIETVLVLDNKQLVENVMDRSKCYLGRAPQSFYLIDIYNCHLKAKEIGKHDFIDSAMLMKFFGFSLHTVEGPINNIKVTTPMDFYLLKAILDAKENEQIKVL